VSRNLWRVIENAISLLVLQSGNYIVPLVLTPYLIIKLGIADFGTLSFIIAINTFFRVFVSYGFDFTATKTIAENHSNLSEISKVFTDVIFSKLILCIISFMVLSLLILFFDKFNANNTLLLSYFLLVIADVFFPAWLFQGLQNMKFITFLKLLSKFSYVFLVMLVVESGDDIILVPMIEGSIAIIVSLISIIFGLRYFKLRFLRVSIKRCLSLIKNSRHVFISKAAVLFYTSLNTVILGLMFSSVVVGYYSIAEKIYMAAREVFRPFIQAVFPYLASFRKNNYSIFCKYVRYSFFLLLLLLTAFSMALFYFSEMILDFLMEEDFHNSLDILKVFSITLLFAIGGFLSSILVLDERGTTLSKVTLSTVIVNIILVYPLLMKFGAIGLAYTFLFVQCYHFLIQLYVNREILTNVKK